MTDPAPTSDPTSDPAARRNALRDAKRGLRARLLAVRREVHAQRGPSAATALAARAAGELEREFGDRLSRLCVGAFWPMGDEIDVRPLLDALLARGVTAALPVMQGRDAPLAFRRWSPGDELAAAVFGVSEPLPAAAEAVPGVLLVPLLAFDAAGRRLGYGGGFYDRTLADRRRTDGVFAVGVCYDEQEVATVPVHGGDEPLDMVVTDRRTLRFARPAPDDVPPTVTES